MQLSKERVAELFAEGYLARYGRGTTKEQLLANPNFMRDAELWWRLVKGDISWTRFSGLDPQLAEMIDVPQYIVANVPQGSVLPERVRVVLATHPERGLRLHDMERQAWLEDDSGDIYGEESEDSSYLDAL